MDTVDDVRQTAAEAAGRTARLAWLSGACLLAGLVLAGLAIFPAPAARAVADRAAGSGVAGDARAGRPGAVVLIGIGGLRWSDISQRATPVLWRLAQAGSVGSLSVTGVDTLTCPADAWLSLNGGARALDPHPATGPCPGLPAVLPGASTSPAGTSRAGTSSAPPGPARIPAMPALVRANRPFSYQPDWGLLGGSGTGQCVTAIGPGAALAAASRSGQVQSYLPDPGRASRPVLGACALTVADLGALPGPAGTSARARALRAADQQAGRIAALAPPGAIVVVAGLGDTAPHLQAIIVSGPGYRSGLLTAASTRQPGLVQITDLTRSVLTWLGRTAPASNVGTLITAAPRGALAGAVRGLAGLDVAAQVYRTTLTVFFGIYAGLEIGIFGLAALLLRGGDPARRRRRRAVYRTAGVSAAAVPAGTFLASLVPWPLLAHPVPVLYGLAAGWAAVIALAALAGPWRRDPFGPPGFVAAVTVAVIGLDVITGSHLQLDTPFGLFLLLGGRFYGVGNNALGVYGTAGILAAAWAGHTVMRRSGRGRAVAAAGMVAAFVVLASGWPGFGAKVGGTIAMVPAFGVLLAAMAGLRVTAGRGLFIAISGLALVTAFAVLDYLLPGVGPSDIGAFVGHVLHGGAGAILHRKVSSNLHSLAESWLAPLVPAVAAGTGAMLAWPSRLGLRTLARSCRLRRLLRPALVAMWLAAVLGWFADDSGISVAAAAIPVALPLAVVLVTGIAAAGEEQPPQSPPGPGQPRLEARQADPAGREVL